ncbi:GPR endopeptidase [Vallitalea pronyensis]|uniref:Germination protease n=1 Tax=Vallitalea pronyensis TaxID=1348613 RepID=A0A8J8MLH2_9FIRM|nr:GPR endopeptidase [Vallitalea pronyensis]QUI23880.1 GPR endopeptidase [Vallitalea pronyensis]
MDRDQKDQLEQVEERYNVRTDLAIEAREMVGEEDVEIQGVEVVVDNLEDIDLSITKVNVMDEHGAKALNKPIGNYITMECELMKQNDPEAHEEIVRELAKQLTDLVKLNKDMTVLVVGLGNRDVTPDALGPRAVSNVLVTRHLFKEFGEPEDGEDSFNKVTAIIPGVMGQTGMETFEIIEGLVKEIKPSVIIAIDALASRRTSRVNTTIQIADTGVHPGSGVGNRRKGLNKESLGVPVIAIGVPTVVDAATIVNDTMEELLVEMKKQIPENAEICDMINSFSEQEKYGLIKEVLYPYVGNMFVTPKEIDAVIKRLSNIIASALNIMLQPKLEFDEITKFLS